MNDNENLLTELEEKIGYTFVDKTFLNRALTAPSYRATHGLCLQADNQRLEFLGDAVLGLLAAEHVYHKYDQHAEGVLTIQRSHLASGYALAMTARAIGLGAYMRIGISDETTGGVDKEKLLADGLEAVFGAAWCDGGLPAVSKIFQTLLQQKLEDIPSNHWANNPKGYLQAICQHHGWTDSPVYQMTDSAGAAHEPVYTVRVSVKGGYEATGTGRSKRKAEADAARHLLCVLSVQGIG
ncbi:MAG: ribonuclease III [bacterium]